MSCQKLKEAIEKNLSDCRRTSHGHILHKLVDIVVIALCSTICGGEDFNDMETFGNEKHDFLKKFLELPNGIPDSDTFRRTFERLDPSGLANCLYEWLADLRGDRPTVAIDGKTIKGSASASRKARHIVSAFVAENQIVLGELATEEKSNEITAVPKLLDAIDVENAIVTADAMSCQRAITAKIIERKADYILGLKSNQPELYAAVDLFFKVPPVKIKHLEEEPEKDHGRLETRRYALVTEIEWLDTNGWTGVNAIAKVEKGIIDKQGTHSETRYFITSLTNLDEFAHASRKHWAIENNLHWCLDVVFREDASRAKKDNSPLNMNVLRKIALSCVRKSKAKYKRVSFRKMMFMAALNEEKLLEALLA